MRRLGVTGGGDSLALYEGPSFYSLCEDARKQRKPILVLMIRDKSNRKHHKIVKQTIASSAHVRETINTRYLLYGLYH